MRKRALACALISIAVASAQTQVDLKTQSKDLDFSTASSTKPVRLGSVLPATCNLGELFFLTTAPPGANLYACVATNTWTTETGGGTASLLFSADGTSVGQRNIANFVTGPGLVNVITDTGTRINIQNSIDTAVVETKAGSQGGSTLLCASASASGSAYTCAMTPSLTAYTSGMLLHWKPDVSGAGGATTLNIDTLGAKAVKLFDGASNPLSANIVAGRLYNLWYDGTAFRLQTGDNTVETKANEQSGAPLLCASASASTSVYSCAMNPTLTAYTSGMFLHWKPDVSGAGGATTLNIDTLGAKAVKLFDGVNDPTAADLIAGQLYNLWYDGAAFRLQTPPVILGASGTRPACATVTRGRVWQTLGGTGVQDTVAVCAKDAADVYAWRSIY